MIQGWSTREGGDGVGNWDQDLDWDAQKLHGLYRL